MARQYFSISTYGPIPAHTDPATEGYKSFEYTAPYAPADASGNYVEWNFPVTVPTGKAMYITDMMFESKCVRYPSQDGTWRNSIAVIDTTWTLSESSPIFKPTFPLMRPAGFVITGHFQNNSPEEQNMIVRVMGYLDDV